MSNLLKVLLAPYMASRMYVTDPESGDADAGDSSALSGTDAVGTNNDARVAMLNAIADQVENEQADQLGDVNDDGTTSPFQPPKLATEDDPLADPDAEVLPSEPVAEPAPVAEQKFKIKVNGREIELTQAELIARAQKVESADDYLRRAAEEKKRLERVARPPAPSQEELQRSQDEEDQALVRALQMGSPEEATAAIRKIREQASARPSITPDDVSRTIDERLAFNSAITTYRAEYQDIVSDPYLDKLALDRDAQLLAAGDDRPYLERYREIGEELRTWVKSKAPVAEKPEVLSLEAKKEKKAAAPRVPVPASVKNKVVEAESEEDDTPSSVIANMRQQRGGPQWMRN